MCAGNAQTTTGKLKNGYLKSAFFLIAIMLAFINLLEKDFSGDRQKYALGPVGEYRKHLFCFFIALARFLNPL